MMHTYECDVCGRRCTRLHHLVAYQTDAAACDDCYGYDPREYDEEPDPLLVDRRPKSVVPVIVPDDGEPPF